MITKLIEHLPHFYQESEFVKELQGAYTKELDNIKELSEKLLDQMFVETSDISLDYWEKMLCIKKTKDNNEDRRIAILEKIRSKRTTTIKIIEDLAFIHTKLPAIIEVKHSKYYYVVRFVTFVGYPKGIENLARAIEKINPAHLGVRWYFTFNRHIDFKGSSEFPKHYEYENSTHNTLFNFTHEQLEDINDIAGKVTKPMTHREMSQWRHRQLRCEDIFNKNINERGV